MHCWEIPKCYCAFVAAPEERLAEYRLSAPFAQTDLCLGHHAVPTWTELSQVAGHDL